MGILFTILFWLFVIILIVKLFQLKAPPAIFSHWYHLIENLQHSSQDFYSSVEKALEQRNLPEIEISRIDHHEGGVFSAKREYLRVDRREHTFDICAAPFGNK